MPTVEQHRISVVSDREDTLTMTYIKNLDFHRMLTPLNLALARQVGDYPWSTLGLGRFAS